MKDIKGYVGSSPSNQNLVDLFQGEWSSRFPAHAQVNAQPGKSALFEDERLVWAEQKLGAFRGKSVLELGPLEAGHSYFLQQQGASEVIAVEANRRAFLKCLCAKEMLGLDRVQFLLGDFMGYLENCAARFDTVIASGVLYHMTDPVHLLSQLSKVSNSLFLWTHYYDKEQLSRKRWLSTKYSSPLTAEYGDFRYEYATHTYKRILRWSGFCGGPNSTSRWLSRDSILNALRYFGFEEMEIGFDQPDHANGPSFAISAKKRAA